MWNRKINNYIWNHIDNPKKHIERVLSAQKITNNQKSSISKFTKLRLSNHNIEEKNNKTKEENKKLFHKIIKADIVPSKRSKKKEQKKCPSFNKNKISFNKIKTHFSKYRANLRFYNKLKKVKSFNHNKNIIERNIYIDNYIQKSIFELQSSLFLKSPHVIKNPLQTSKRLTKYSTSKIKKCKSLYTGKSSKTTISFDRNSQIINKKNKTKVLNNNYKKNNPHIITERNLKRINFLHKLLFGNKKTDNKEKNQKIIKSSNITKQNKIKQSTGTNKIIKTQVINNNDKNKNTSLNKKNDNNVNNKKYLMNEEERLKKINLGLKRNLSKINIFNQQ